MTPNDWVPAGWEEPKDLRPRYRVCRAAFALSALGLGMLALDHSCYLIGIFGRNFNLMHLRETQAWTWLVGAPLTWGTFLGSLLFLGRFDDPGWKKRSVLLFFMNSIDLGTWCIAHAEVLGIASGVKFVQLDLFLELFGPFMNFVELLLFAALAQDVCHHLDRPDSASAFVATRGAVLIGMLLTAIVLLNLVHFGKGGIMVRKNGDPLVLLIYLASKIAMTIAAYTTTYLMALACQQCSWVVNDLNRQKREDDPFLR